ncbi:uncharacterized protein LOC132607910 [Lycium barbarum]|uniref:uncharacterized protein LOC132607910 n=1 Tax=Lycium barbarum TaxID=112863 RepID=UPI00293E776C|nr:uncharacterized protein LOC132607910 [Lycium barbarum]
MGALYYAVPGKAFDENLQNVHEVGNLIYAQAEDMGITTNTDAEVMAILEALRYCRIRGMDNIFIQTDCDMVYKILEEGWKSPWGITIWIEEIKDFRNNMNVSYSHSLREGNKLADALANQALDDGLRSYKYKVCRY